MGGVVTITRNSMANRKTSGSNDLGEVNIRCGILSPLLFVIIKLPLTLILRKLTAGYKMCIKEMKAINHLLFKDDLKLYAASKDQLDSLIQSLRVFSQDIRMSSGLNKHPVLDMKRGGKQHSSEVELLNGPRMRKVEDVRYKYLGILSEIRHLMLR